MTEEESAMLRLSGRQRVILGVATLLIVLRLFFPVQECSRGRGTYCFEYRANASATMLHVIGIAILAAVLLAIVPSGRRNPEPQGSDHATLLPPGRN